MNIFNEDFLQWLFTTKPVAVNGNSKLYVGFEESYYYIFDGDCNSWISDSNEAFEDLLKNKFPEHS